MRLDPLDQDAAEDVRPGVVRGDPDAGGAGRGGEALAVGRAGGKRGEQVDAGVARESVGDRQALGRGERVGALPAEASARSRRPLSPPRRGGRGNRPSPPRRVRRRDTIRAW